MDWKKFHIYFTAPFGVTFLLVVCYFSGVPFLQGLVTPAFENMDVKQRREFGILENLQNIVLLVMVVMAIIGARRQSLPVLKWGFVGIALFSTFIFLEEIDYGLHYYEILRGVPREEMADVRNWHNEGDRTTKTKQLVDIGLVVWFGLAPFAAQRTKDPRFRIIVPDRYSVATLIAALLIRTIAHTLRDQGFGEGGGIQKNTSEFRELITYAVFMLYLYELAFKRELASLFRRED
jgi:hypothetical protein